MGVQLPAGLVPVQIAPGGALPPYPPEAPIPATSAREAERQRRMKDGTW